MEPHGFIHDMLDVKVLLLYMMCRLKYPVDVQKAYELALQDDCVSYFDVAQALPQMVESGHLTCSADGLYTVTQKGRDTGKVTDNTLAYPVMQRVKSAVERFNQECRRDNYVHIQTLEKANGDYTVVMGLDDAVGNLMTLEMSAPGRRQAMLLSRAFREKAEGLYQMIVTELLKTQEQNDAQE